MQGIGETFVNTVAALATTSLGHFGVTLKDPPLLPRSEPAVVRRISPSDPAVGRRVSIRPHTSVVGPSQYD